MSDIEKAEKLGRRRARLLVITGVMLIALQVLYFAQVHAPRHNDLHVWITLGGWSFLVLTMLFALITGGGYGYGKQVRALVNDESAMANRDAALRLGFAMANLAALGVFLMAHHNHHIGGRFAAHLIITASLGAALIRFGLLEWKAHRLG